MLTILLDENIEGYAEYLSRLLFSPAWSEVSTALGLRILGFGDAGLARATPDVQVWEFCQEQHFFLITDNRNEDKADSLEATIRTRSVPTSLPVFTISDINRFRTEREYPEALVAKLLEYLIDADRLLGTGRLYLP